MSRVLMSISASLLIVVFALSCSSSDGSSLAGTGVHGTGGGSQIEVLAPVTSFGSIYAGGIHFGTDSARVLNNGQKGALGDLRSGMFVYIKGRYFEGSSSGNAELIDYRPRLAGRVQSLDVASGNMAVNGVHLSIAYSSQYGYGNTLAGLSLGSPVVLSGDLDANGIFQVTYLAENSNGLLIPELAALPTLEAPASGLFVRTGSVSELSGNSFRMQGVLVHLSSSTILEGAGTGPNNNDRADVMGRFQADGSVLAMKINVHPPLPPVSSSGNVEAVDETTSVVSVGGAKYRVTVNTVFVDNSVSGGGQLGLSSLKVGDNVTIFVSTVNPAADLGATIDGGPGIRPAAPGGLPELQILIKNPPPRPADGIQQGATIFTPVPGKSDGVQAPAPLPLKDPK